MEGSCTTADTALAGSRIQFGLGFGLGCEDEEVAEAPAAEEELAKDLAKELDAAQNVSLKQSHSKKT